MNIGRTIAMALRTLSRNRLRSFLMMLGVMTVVGVFLSDMLLMWLDPRVRMERGG